MLEMIQIAFAAIAGVATLFAYAASVLARRGSPWGVRMTGLRPADETRKFDLDDADAGLQRRVAEVQERLTGLNSRASFMRASANALAVVHVVVGGVLLTSPLLTDTLSPLWISGLGLIVLGSAAIDREFQPRARALSARRLIVRMQQLDREIDFDVASFRETGSPTLLQIQRKLIDHIKEIDDLELAEEENAALVPPAKQPELPRSSP
jgi:hypothetical protein